MKEVVKLKEILPDTVGPGVSRSNRKVFKRSSASVVTEAKIQFREAMEKDF